MGVRAAHEAHVRLASYLCIGKKLFVAGGQSCILDSPLRCPN
jgi:hypothetical protein